MMVSFVSWRNWSRCSRDRGGWIVQAPTRLVDYVVAHELVHLKHPDHTREFWSALGSVMPDYEERRERLRLVGRVMVW